jgi:ribosomal protein L37AE/L43A
MKDEDNKYTCGKCKEKTGVIYLVNKKWLCDKCYFEKPEIVKLNDSEKLITT